MTEDLPAYPMGIRLHGCFRPARWVPQQHPLDGLGVVWRHKPGNVDTEKDLTGIPSTNTWKRYLSLLVLDPSSSLCFYEVRKFRRGSFILSRVETP